MKNKKTKLEELIKTYEQGIYKIANQILKDTKAAEDITQEVFMIIESKIGGIKGIKDDETKHYIALITKNKAIDLYRKIERESDHTTITDPKELEAVSAVNSEEEETERYEQLIAEILKMPTKYSEAMYKCLVEEKTYKKAARELCITEEALRQRIHRGKAKLKEVLDNEQERNK